MEKKEKSEEAADGTSQAAPSITVKVKYRGKITPFSLSPEATVGDLKSRLHSFTNIIPSAQKLLFGDGILEDSMTLKSLQMTSSSNIRIIPAYKPLKMIEQDEPELPVPNLRINPFAVLSIGRFPSQRWKISGVVTLGRRCLKGFPDEVWDCAAYVRILDISNNYIQELPEKIAILKLLNKLYLNSNDFSDEKISWDGLTQLKSLTVLSFNNNRLATLPPSVGSLTSLTQLYVANNKLTCLPDELGCLNQLRSLNAECNRISSLPATIGNCSSLAKIVFSNNCLTKLPETFTNLRSLKILRLNNNALNSLPSNLFKMCTKLKLLCVDLTGITVSRLRQMEGYGEFDARRRWWIQKKIDDENYRRRDL